MKVLLIDPQWQRPELGPKMAMGCLAAAVKDLVEIDAMEFHITAEGLEAISRKPSLFWHKEAAFLEEIEHILQSDDDIKIIAITGWTGAFPRMLRITSLCKLIRPEVKVIFGGSHTTLYERHTPLSDSILLQYKDVDYLVVGEGEETFRNLILNILYGDKKVEQISGLVWRKEKNIIRNDFISHHYNKLPNYTPDWNAFIQNRTQRLLFFVEGSRGCPHQCAFCDEAELWIKYRTRRATSIVDEIEKGQEKFGTSFFRFTDSSITSSHNGLAICDEIIRRNLQVSWSAFARADEITEKTASTLAEAGCKCVLIGVESGSQKILDSMRKGTSINHILNSVKILKERKIQVRGSFIIGFPGECEADILSTINFARQLSLDAYAWHAYQPPFRALTEKNRYQVDFTHYELDVPSEVYIQVLERHPSLLIDMHSLPKVLSMGNGIRPSPDKWPKESKEMSRWLRLAISQTSEEREHDLDLLINLAREKLYHQGNMPLVAMGQPYIQKPF